MERCIAALRGGFALRPHRGHRAEDSRQARPAPCSHLALGVSQRFEIGCLQILAQFPVERQAIALGASAVLAGDDAATARRNAPSAPHTHVETELPLFVGAPFEEPSLFIRAEIVEGAANDEVATPCTIGVDMEIVLVRADIVVATRPQYVASSVDNGTLSGVIRSHENIETRRELKLQRSGRIEAPEAARIDFGNVHRRLPARFFLSYRAVGSRGDVCAALHERLERLGFIEKEPIVDHPRVIFCESLRAVAGRHELQTAVHG